MNYSKQLYGIKARKALMRGARELYKAVSTTLGPRGRNVILQKDYDLDVLHDGVKVSRQIKPKDKYERSGADLLREAAEKQVNIAGDGTTLSVVLGYHIAKEAMTLIDSGVNAMSLRSGLEKGRDILIKTIQDLAKPIKTKKEKVQVATISAQDEELGKMIGETYHKVGLDGVIVADESKTDKTTLEHEEGISINRGYVSPYFVTDPSNMTAAVKDCHIMITDRELEDVFEFLDFVEKVLKPNNIRNLVLIAGEVKGTLLASMIQTKRQGMMNLLAIKAPAFGQYRKELLEDIAVMTGGNFISDDDHKRLGDWELEDLGYAEHVKATKEATTILGNKGDEQAIKDRVSSIKHLMNDPDTEYDEEKLKERLSKMMGGVYVIRTGGATEVEMMEKKERVEDAILATRSAIVSGIVPGGEVTFLSLANVLKQPQNQDDEYAYRILERAIKKPFEKLLTNAGLNPGYYQSKVEIQPFGHGVDVTDNTVKDMIEAGIVDPAAVLIESLRSAVSVAILLITSDAVSIIVEENDK